MMKPKVVSVFLISGTLFLLALYHRAPHIISENTITGSDELESKNYEENFHSLLSQATSGQEFSGLPFRTFPPNLRKFYNSAIITIKTIPEHTGWNCTKWGVVTSIFAPPKQEAVRRFLYRKDWCVVVVGDKNKPQVCFKVYFSKKQ